MTASFQRKPRSIAYTTLIGTAFLAGGCGGSIASAGVADSGSASDGASVSARASDPMDSGPPSTPVGASTDAAIDAPSEAQIVLGPDSGAPAQCQTTEDVLFVDGDQGEITHAGPLLLGPSAGGWSGMCAGYGIEIHLFLNDTRFGDAWEVRLSSQGLDLPLTTQVYDMVQIDPTIPGYAGMYIVGGWQACGTVDGWFRIEEITVTPPQELYGMQTLKSLTATFEQRCNGERATLRGCVHFQQ
jgi:hypothetical protein